MNISPVKFALASLSLCAAFVALKAANDPNNPTWWDKYTSLAKNGALGDAGSSASVTFRSNVDLSNECGRQSETSITLDTMPSLCLYRRNRTHVQSGDCNIRLAEHFCAADGMPLRFIDGVTAGERNR
jgi:hypothetical protein